ncbi:MAG TPA: hypothetical protein VFH88_02085 [Candidatus Krumholzibacteria bacterium]|nr:hypothetical protein [Candidatus Krumholzibacteria bacterium]
MKVQTLALAVVLAAAGLSAACTRAVVYKDHEPGPVVVHEDEHGPPAHAPANGYRRNHEERGKLDYDSHLGVYVVVGYDNCYYSAGQYFRFISDRWEWSVSIEGEWKVVARVSDVPPGLRTKHGHGHGHENGNGHHRD